MSVNFEIVPAGKSFMGVATLNAEKSLNALSLSMIESLHSKLDEWKLNSDISGILIKGSGRAFCAGGDIRALNDSMRANDSNIQKFFEKEYSLDCSLYTYPKSIIVWAHGITMGGGMGIMQGAKFRVVTDSTRLAMPEITIGLYPDVGASYFLKKVPKSWGLFIALSGVRLKATEAVQLHMADFWLKDEELESFLNHVKSLAIHNSSTFHSEVEKYFNLKKQSDEGGDIFSHSHFVEAFLQNTSPQSLIAWAKSYLPKDDWEALLLKSILSACPTSLGIIYALWEKAKDWNVAESFYHDWFIATQCGKNGNFQEGVRALLIDKDNKPHWNPATAEELSVAHIEAHFKSPLEDGKNPLEYLLRA